MTATKHDRPTLLVCTYTDAFTSAEPTNWSLPSTAASGAIQITARQSWSRGHPHLFYFYTHFSNLTP